jgi:SAM-dependent methyltransferase
MLNSHRKTIFETLGRNPIHPFPARMAPGIALDALGESKTPLRVLDPMAGSGTVLAVARANGHHAIGVDLDPLAVLLAGVWTRTVDPGQIREKAVEVLDRARLVFGSLTTARAYPSQSNEETRAFIRYWFDNYARRQLAALSTAIRRIRDNATRDALWCGFSRLIITKCAGASLAMDLSHSRPHKKFDRAPVKPFTRFLSAVETVVSNCPHTGGGTVGPVAVTKLGDARQLDVESGTIDLVLTSPPYLNAIDYLRCSKFSLVWMGYNVDFLREIRGESIGAEASSKQALESPWVLALIKQLGLTKKLSSRDCGLLARYVFDMGGALAEVSRVLKAGGRAVFVVGDSTVRGTFIRNSEIVKSVAENHGLVVQERRSRTLPANRRYLPPPKKGADSASIEGRMRREVVLAFKKPIA